MDMFRAGYPTSKLILHHFCLFLVLVLGAFHCRADAVLSDLSVSGSPLSKNELLTYVAGLDREALYTLLDLDSWCEGGFSSSQLFSVYKSDEFRELSNLRLAQDSGQYYDFIFEYQCPDSDSSLAQMAASD
jgi:hypothetical protein